MTVTEQFVEKYNLRQKKYVDLSFVGDAYDYSTFELAVADVNANTTTNALTNGETGAVRVFKGEEISVIRLLQDIELTAQTLIKSNAIVDFNGFTMSEASGYTNSYFLVSRWIENNPVGVAFYARNGGTIQTKNRTVSLGLVSEYAAVIGLTIKNNWDIINTKNDTVCSIRIGNSKVETSCESKIIIEDCSIHLSTAGDPCAGNMIAIYDMNNKNTQTAISNTKIEVNNENWSTICQGVSLNKNGVFKNLKMINCKVELNSTQEQASSVPIGVQFDGEQLIMIDCYIKTKSTKTSCMGLARNGGIARIQNSDIIALSPNLQDSSAIGIYHSSGTSYLKDTNVFGVTSGIQNNDTIYIDGGYLRAPGHGGLYNSDNAENTGAKAYVCGTTLAQAIGDYQEFGATCSGSSGATYNGSGCYTWFDNCTFKGAKVVCKYSTDETDDDNKGANVYISNSYSELGYRCDKGTTLTLGTGVTGSNSVTGTGGVGTVNHTNDDYSEIVEMNIPSELYTTVADYLNDLNKARIDLANLAGANELATISTLADKLVTAIDEVYTKGYEKGKSEGGGGMNMANYASDFQFTSDDWATSDTVVLDVPNLSDMNSTFFNMDFLKIKHLTINSNTPIGNCLYAFRGNNGGGILETVVLNIDTSQCTNWNNMFFKQIALKRVEGAPLNFSGATSISPFSYTYYVEHFRVVPESIKIKADFGHCTMIDDDTVDSVVNGLFDLTGATAQTLTLNAKVKARIEADDAKEETDPTKHRWLSTITGKNWTIA